jgi:hypothetical protein
MERLLAAAVEAALADEDRKRGRLHGLGAVATGAALASAVHVVRRRGLPGNLPGALRDIPDSLRDIPDSVRDRLADAGLFGDQAEPDLEEDVEPDLEEDVADPDLEEDEELEPDLEDEPEPEDDAEDEPEDYEEPQDDEPEEPDEDEDDYDEEDDEDFDEGDEEEDWEDEREPEVVRANGRLDPVARPPEPPSEGEERE